MKLTLNGNNQSIQMAVSLIDKYIDYIYFLEAMDKISFEMLSNSINELDALNHVIQYDDWCGNFQAISEERANCNNEQNDFFF